MIRDSPSLNSYLDYVLTLIPLGDEEQLGQTLRITVADFNAELPQQLFLVLEKLCVVFVVHDFFQLHVLQRAEITQPDLNTKKELLLC